MASLLLCGQHVVLFLFAIHPCCCSICVVDYFVYKLNELKHPHLRIFPSRSANVTNASLLRATVALYLLTEKKARLLRRFLCIESVCQEVWLEKGYVLHFSGHSWFIILDILNAIGSFFYQFVPLYAVLFNWFNNIQITLYSTFYLNFIFKSF